MGKQVLQRITKEDTKKGKEIEKNGAQHHQSLGKCKFKPQ